MRPPPGAVCAQCEFFSLKVRPELAPIGRGECSGFVVHPMSVVDWNDAACGVFQYDRRNAAAREEWMAAMRERHSAK